MQTKTMSVIEAVTNTVSGYLLAVALQIIILPMVGFEITASESFVLAAPFVLASMVKSYIVRRIFNYFIRRKNESDS